MNEKEKEKEMENILSDLEKIDNDAKRVVEKAEQLFL